MGTPEELSQTEEDQENDDSVPQKSSRRVIFGAGAAAAAVGVLGGIVILADRAVGNKTENPYRDRSDREAERKAKRASGNYLLIEAAEAREIIDSADFPENDYHRRPWANPGQYQDLSPKQLTRVMVIPYGPEGHDVTKFGEAVVRNLEAIGNSALTEEHVRRAIELGYPVGETDGIGNTKNGLRQYALDNLIDHMIKGMFDESYTDRVAIMDQLKHFLSRSAMYYERSLYDERYREVADFRISMLSAKDSGRSRSGLLVEIKIQNPTITQDEYIGNLDTTVHLTDEGDRYGLVVKSVELEG